MNLDNPISKKFYDLIQKIENLGCSYELTETVLMAGKLHDDVINARTPQTIEIPFDEETLWITGQPCFAIIGIAEGLRKLGMQIKRKSEDEQAHVAIWALNLYLKHGKDKWREEAVKLIKSVSPLQPSPQAGGENE